MMVVLNGRYIIGYVREIDGLTTTVVGHNTVWERGKPSTPFDFATISSLVILHTGVLSHAQKVS